LFPALIRNWTLNYSACSLVTILVMLVNLVGESKRFWLNNLQCFSWEQVIDVIIYWIILLQLNLYKNGRMCFCPQIWHFCRVWNWPEWWPAGWIHWKSVCQLWLKTLLPWLEHTSWHTATLFCNIMLVSTCQWYIKTTRDMQSPRNPLCLIHSFHSTLLF